MTPEAKAWDERHGAPDSSFATGTPKSSKAYKAWLQTADTTNRPCDWCGCKLGKPHITIHEECAKKEWDFYMDLLY